MSEPVQEVGTERSEATHGGLLRLGCCYCDRTDFDGVDSIPTDWKNVQEIRTEELGIWETHLGVCPDCFATDEVRFATSCDGSPPWDESEMAIVKDTPVHPIVKQIINRDCHVGESNQTVVRHVISKLKQGYEGFRQMPKADRRMLIAQCIKQHRGNFKEYVEVMSGFTRTVGGKLPVDGLPEKLSGPEVVRLMRKHKLTIEQLAFRLGSTMKRVREVRRKGLTRALVVRDWLQAITGEDPGPIPEKYRVSHISEEGSCGFCGCPLYVGDDSFDYVGEMFCSIYCARKSRGW
jgi:hypothetical protein